MGFMKRVLCTIVCAVLLAASCSSSGEPGPQTPAVVDQPTAATDAVGETLDAVDSAEEDPVFEATTASEPEYPEVNAYDIGGFSDSHETPEGFLLTDSELRPQRAHFGDDRAYLSELIPWLIYRDDYSEEPSLRPVHSKEVEECFVDAFMESFDERRLDEVVEALDAADLSEGIPASLVTEQETANMRAAAAPCVKLILRAALEADSGLGAIPGADLVSDIPPEVIARLKAGARECVEGLHGADDFLSYSAQEMLFAPADTADTAEMMLEDFDPGVGTFLEVCGNSLLIPAGVEGLVSEGQISREDADCVRDTLVTMHDEALAVVDDPGEVALASMMVVSFGMLTATALCDALPGVTNGTSEESP